MLLVGGRGSDAGHLASPEQSYNATEREAGAIVMTHFQSFFHAPGSQVSTLPGAEAPSEEGHSETEGKEGRLPARGHCEPPGSWRS